MDGKKRVRLIVKGLTPALFRKFYVKDIASVDILLDDLRLMEECTEIMEEMEGDSMLVDTSKESFAKRFKRRVRRGWSEKGNRLCFRCNSEEHLVKDCPVKPTTQNEVGKVSFFNSKPKNWTKGSFQDPQPQKSA